MITLSKKHDHVRMDMSTEDYDLLLMFLGLTLGYLRERDENLFWPFLEMTNQMNAGNPQYQPYEIPPEHRGKRERLVAEVAAYAEKRRPH